MGWRREDLTYCSNVHPGEDLAALLATVARIGQVRQRRGLERMAAGLWIAAGAARQLAVDDRQRTALKRALEQARLELYTINGFPYGNFHQGRVKEEVYLPHWGQPQRLAYTRDLARVLADCLAPDQAEGTISTLPLGFAPTWSEEHQEQALEHLCDLAGDLATLAQDSGRSVRVCLEPEPGCALENTPQALALLADRLPAVAARRGLDPQVLSNHLGLCYDICHQAVMFEDARDSLARLAEAGITVGKIQVSSALAVPRPDDPATARALVAFAEPRYLHQTTARDETGRTLLVTDLDQARDRLPPQGPWRVHFHLPIQAGELEGGQLATTREEIGRVLDHLARPGAPRPQLEVETYTWQVLPPGLRPQDEAGLLDGLTAEIHWLEEQLDRRGLLEKS